MLTASWASQRRALNLGRSAGFDGLGWGWRSRGRPQDVEDVLGQLHPRGLGRPELVRVGGGSRGRAWGSHVDVADALVHRGVVRQGAVQVEALEVLGDPFAVAAPGVGVVVAVGGRLRNGCGLRGRGVGHLFPGRVELAPRGRLPWLCGRRVGQLVRLPVLVPNVGRVAGPVHVEAVRGEQVPPPPRGDLFAGAGGVAEVQRA